METSANTNENKVELYSVNTETSLAIPYMEAGVSAGFPSPALDFEDVSIDLNRQLIKHPSATFYGRVKGVSLKDAGIDDGDLLVIDKSLEPKDGKFAVCYIDGEFTAKRLQVSKEGVWLMPENKNYKPILVTEETSFLIWGIITYVIKKM